MRRCVQYVFRVNHFMSGRTVAGARDGACSWPISVESEMPRRVSATTFALETPDAVSLFVYRWLPEKPVKAVVQLARGWAEHAGRYAEGRGRHPRRAPGSDQAIAPGPNPPKLPSYVSSGTRDPVGSNIEAPLEAYRAAGLEDVRHEFYPLGRHESLNEINRDEVTRDLIAWLDAVVASGPPPPSSVPATTSTRSTELRHSRMPQQRGGQLERVTHGGRAGRCLIPGHLAERAAWYARLTELHNRHRAVPEAECQAAGER